MSSQLIYSIVPATLLLMLGGLYFSTRTKPFTLANVSSHTLSRNLDSSNHSSNHSSRSRQSSMDTANYVASDNESVGGKKRKTRKK